MLDIPLSIIPYFLKDYFIGLSASEMLFAAIASHRICLFCLELTKLLFQLRASKSGHLNCCVKNWFFTPVAASSVRKIFFKRKNQQANQSGWGPLMFWCHASQCNKAPPLFYYPVQNYQWYPGWQNFLFFLGARTHTDIVLPLKTKIENY